MKMVQECLGQCWGAELYLVDSGAGLFKSRSLIRIWLLASDVKVLNLKRKLYKCVKCQN